ncbi:uncharacterized protein LOC126575842 [Anopheles aquasalis]|uniref:uncharacterized protein LOC126575842 n=1 Tax=Anopheles aquasalis TaxID=42839 RepID=UPI00215A2636|nr:uncharacterized protein LOC126575842 [Anopheles aquasalis]
MSLLGGSPATEGDRKEEHSEDHLLTYDPENEEQVSTFKIESSEAPLSYSVQSGLQDSDRSMLVTIKTLVETLLNKKDTIEKRNDQIERQNAEIVEQNALIELENAGLVKKIDAMDRIFSGINVQQFNAAKDYVATPSFTFEPMNTIEQLIELENKLNDESYRAELVAWLVFNVVGKNSQKRMSSCLDMLFSRELLINCSWTGMSRDETKKAALRNQRNIINLFKAIGTTLQQKVDDRKVTKFFIQKLKGAKERFLVYKKIERVSQEIMDDITINVADSSNIVEQNVADSLEDSDSEISFKVEILQYMFLVVEIVNDKGEKEWKVAPKRWVCTTKNTRRTVLLWPHEMGAERQMHLVKEGICKPMKSWSRQECIVRQECSTYDGANAALKVAALLRPRPKAKVTIPMVSAVAMVQSGQTLQQDNEDPLNIDDPNEVLAEPSAETQLHTDRNLSTMVSIKSMVQSLMAKLEKFEKLNARIEKQYAHIVEQNVNIIERNKSIEKTNAALLTKIDVMQKTLHNLDSQQLSTTDTRDLLETCVYSFKPMETIEQVTRLEQKLNDASYRRKLLSWLTINVTGKNAKRRMSTSLDLLFSRELVTKCSWSGIARDGTEKVAMRNHQNIVDLFKAVGTTPRERIDGNNLSCYIKAILKNGKQRFLHHQERSVSGKGTNPICNNEQQVGLDGIAITSADSSNAIDRQSMESFDDESQLF